MATTSSFLKNYHPPVSPDYKLIRLLSEEIPENFPYWMDQGFTSSLKPKMFYVRLLWFIFNTSTFGATRAMKKPGALSPLAGLVSAPLGAGKSEVVSYATETMIRKRGPSQAPNYFLDKALCPKQMRLLACGRENRNVCHLGILKTIAFCQINLSAMFAVSPCWCPFLQNTILKRLRFQ